MSFEATASAIVVATTAVVTLAMGAAAASVLECSVPPALQPLGCLLGLAVVVLYLVAGVVIPLDDDHPEQLLIESLGLSEHIRWRHLSLREGRRVEQPAPFQDGGKLRP